VNVLPLPVYPYAKQVHFALLKAASIIGRTAVAYTPSLFTLSSNAKSKLKWCYSTYLVRSTFYL